MIDILLKWFFKNPQIIVPGFGVLGIGFIFTMMKFIYVPRGEAFKMFQTKELSDIKDNHLGEKIEDFKNHMDDRFESLENLIARNGKK